MKDERIIELYFSRDEGAISATADKYGRLLSSISYGVLSSIPDAEECVNDTYLRAWESIPPTRPKSLLAFLSKIVRNLSINRYRKNKGVVSMQAASLTDELSECLPDKDGDLVDELALTAALNRFLDSLNSRARAIFVKRYFFCREIEDIARELDLSVSNVKVMLYRARLALREMLEKENISI